MTAERVEGLPRRFLPAFLLLSLARDGTSYGYELYETVSSLGLSADLAAVYRGLRTMQQRELVTSQWVPSDSGPDRRLYSLTDAGRIAAAAAAEELAAARDSLVAALESFDLRASGGPTRGAATSAAVGGGVTGRVAAGGVAGRVAAGGVAGRVAAGGVAGRVAAGGVVGRGVAGGGAVGGGVAGRVAVAGGAVGGAADLLRRGSRR